MRYQKAPYDLTSAEHEVLRELAKGKRTKEIAQTRHTSHRTIDNQLQSIYGKLHVTSRIQAVLHAIRDGLVDDEAENDSKNR